MSDRISIPQHIGFIMDGNRRWAKIRDVPLIEGHRAGMQNLKPLVKRAVELHIPYLTFWAFSTENKKRPVEQIKDLLTVFGEGVNSSIVEEMLGEGVKLEVIGDISYFPGKLVTKINEITKKSQQNAAICVSIALNYGGEDELAFAMNAIIRDKHTEVNRELLRQYLFAPDQPDMDLVIRTGGEVRTSGFAPVKAAYAEWYFSEILWPDFTPAHLDLALVEFQNRKRNFGH